MSIAHLVQIEARLRQLLPDEAQNEELTDRTSYTLGCAKVYDAALLNPTPEPATKLGRHDDYDGGWVWQTPEEADHFRATSTFEKAFPGRDPNEFCVYMLELPTGWDVDVSGAPHLSDGVHRLLNDARIVKKIPV